MVQVQTQRRRLWAGIIWLSVVAFSLLIAAIDGYTAILFIAGSIALASIIVMSASVPNHRPAARIIWRPVAQRTISSAEGAAQSALVVPIERSDGYEMVLTVEGYKLIDEAGQVVYTLKRR